jgi:short-subunit dehydrogenase
MAIPTPEDGSTALITGASSGIGAALARELAGRGHGVTLVARSEDKLRSLAEELESKHGVRAEVMACDVTDPAARDALAAAVEASGRRVAVLANNAGFGTYKPFAEIDRERLIEETRVNTEAVVDLTARYLPGMVERGAGAVLITSSTAGFQPLPGNALYAAAKSFALLLAEGLHHEVKDSGVSVTALCPGPVKTGFQDASGAHDFASGLPKPLWRTPEQVAAAAVDGLERGKRLVVPGTPNRILAAVGRFSPRPIVLRVMDSS